MNYSELLDTMSKKPRNTVKLSFNVPGEPGQVYQGSINCRIVSKEIDGTTIELINLEVNGSTEMKPTPQVVPSPS